MAFVDAELLEPPSKAAMIFIFPPQCGHTVTSIRKTRASTFALLGYDSFFVE